MAYFHCRCENGNNEAVVVSTEEAERLIESGELVTSDPFEAMGWESEASIYGRWKEKEVAWDIGKAEEWWKCRREWCLHQSLF